MKRSLYSVILILWPVPALAQQAATTADVSADARTAEPTPPAATGSVTQHWQLSLNLDALARTHSSFDVLSDENHELAPGISGSYSFWLSEQLAILPELGYGWSHTSGGPLLGGSIERTELASYAGHGGVSVRYEVWDFFAPHARLGAGLSRTEFSLSTPLDGKFDTEEWLPFATLGVGATVTTPDRFFQTRSGKLSSLSAGLTLEAGYRASSPLNATLESQSEGRLTLEQPDLGELSTSGPYLRFALVARL